MRSFSIHSLLLVLLILPFASTHAQISIIGELSHDRQVHPGEQYEGTVTVLNESEESQEVKIYQTDYTFFADGTNNYAEPGTLPRSNASWIQFSPSHLVLPPRETSDVHFRVSAPQDTSRSIHGSYWSMLMVEGIQRGSPESSFPANPLKKEMGIRQAIRYGIQIASHLANTGNKEVRFLEAHLQTGDDGKHVLQLDIENTGSLGMRPEVYVELFDDTGTKKGRYSGLRYRLYPGTSVRQMIDFDNVLRGNYRALVVIDDGGNDVFAAEYSLEF